MASVFIAVICFNVLSEAAALGSFGIDPCFRDCSNTSPSRTCYYNWTVEWFYTLGKPCGDCPDKPNDCTKRGCITADGIKRPVSLINRKFPGPSVQICLGDEVVFNVKNKMLNGESITIHWHGITQRGSQNMDGAPMVTGWPIYSPGNFQYRFKPTEPGTHWYHSHVGLQRGDGIMGMFIVREAAETDPHRNLYDEDWADHLIFLTDWHHKPLTTVYLQEVWAVGKYLSADSILINGKGIYEGTSPPHPPLEVFSITKGRKYRFRVTNGATMFCNMQFSVENHNLLVIASDGGAFEPEEVDYFRISEGERFDFVLEANQPVGNYKIQVIGLPCENTLGRSATQIAYLHYDGASPPPAMDNLPEIERFGNVSTWWRAFPDKSLAEVKSLGEDDGTASGAKDLTKYIEVRYLNRTDPYTMLNRLIPQLNNISFRFPTSPLLGEPYKAVCNNCYDEPAKCENNECSCIHTIHVDLNQIVEVVLVNSDIHFKVLHPLHLHGNRFRVVAMDKIEGAAVDKVKELYETGKIEFNNKGPLKDVVIVPNGGYTIFRFNASNPGWWLFHCHIQFHLEDGMALLFHVNSTEDLPLTANSS